MRNVLVDTSVWVRHFKQRNQRLAELLDAGMVACHPYVVLEVACGTPPGRRAIIGMLGELESVPVATPGELLALIERRTLWGRGCGFVDLGLLASALLSDTLIWTLDKRFETVAGEIGCSYTASLRS